MLIRYTLLTATLCILGTVPLRAQLNILSQFDPTSTGGTCGIAYNSTAGEVLVYGCFGTTIDRYSEAGVFISSAPMAGESANDVDIDMTPVALVMNGTSVAQGQLLFVNGENDGAEIYAIDEAAGTVIDTLPSSFGASHVVGGSYHPLRNTFFLVQDNVPGGFEENRIAEVDPSTGDTVQTFSVAANFDVSYGDLDISPVSGHLFVVSSNETGIAEYTPDGVFVTEHALPVGVTELSGIALDNDLQGAWVSTVTGFVYKLGNFPIGIVEQAAAGPRLSVHPNPASDRVQVELHALETGHRRIVLRDIGGREVRELFNGVGNGRSFTFMLGDVDPGPYLLVLEGQEVSTARPLIIAR